MFYKMVKVISDQFVPKVITSEDQKCFLKDLKRKSEILFKLGLNDFFADEHHLQAM